MCKKWESGNVSLSDSRMIRFAIRLRWAAAQTCLRDKVLRLPSSLRAYGMIIALKDSAKSARSLKQSTGRAPAPSAAERFLGRGFCGSVMSEWRCSGSRAPARRGEMETLLTPKLRMLWNTGVLAKPFDEKRRKRSGDEKRHDKPSVTQTAFIAAQRAWE